MFTWDQDKARANLAKHGVSFNEARDAFNDPRAIIDVDPEPSEERCRIIGQASGKLLFVVFVENDDGIRIISAREATRREIDAYYRGR